MNTTEPTYTRAELTAALNAGANLVIDHITGEYGESSESIRDASVIDLVVNAAIYRLDHPHATLDEVIEGNYTPDVCADDDEDVVGTVLGWIE